MKPLIVLALLAIVASLGKALFSMSSGPEHSARVVQALTWRIGLSLALFVEHHALTAVLACGPSPPYCVGCEAL
jgi:hypothetical protein